jgi:hypothetical protein
VLANVQQSFLVSGRVSPYDRDITKSKEKLMLNDVKEFIKLESRDSTPLKPHYDNQPI